MKKLFIIALVFIITLTIFLIFIVFKNTDFDSQTAPIYLANIEATVISIELDELEKDNCGVLFETSKICPRDKAIIKIDNIDYVDSPTMPILEIGSEFTVYFKYGARAVKLIKDRKQICEGLDKCPDYVAIDKNGCKTPDGIIIDCDSIYFEEKPTEIEDNHIIYHFAEDYHKFENDIVLPGIKERDRINFTSSVIQKDFVDIYEADSQIYDIEVYDLIS